ncbi:MAG: hypothetical protein R6V43_03780 [Halopseudomonas sp.]
MSQKFSNGGSVTHCSAFLDLLTSVPSEIVSNNAVTVLLTPLAKGVVRQLRADPRPFVVAVMFAASPSSATPIGYQTNALVYSAKVAVTDFMRSAIRSI